MEKFEVYSTQDLLTRVRTPKKHLNYDLRARIGYTFLYAVKIGRDRYFIIFVNTPSHIK